MRDTLQAVLAPSSLALQFAVKTLLGAGLALWCALRFDLEQPQWALMTALIVAQPLSGMVVQKGLARLLGTLVGTVMAVVCMALSVQAPGLFLLALATWLGLCTAASTLLRSAWSYAFVLAGYTVAIIALPALSQPLLVFDHAVARCTEICLGIFCATAVSAVLWPQRVERQLVQQARAAWQSGLDTARATLSGRAEVRQGLLQMLGRIVAVDAQREHAWFEGVRGRQRARAMRGLSRALLSLLRIARAVARQWAMLDEHDAETLAPWLSEVEVALGSADEAELLALRERLQAAARDQAVGAAPQYCLGRLAVLLLYATEAGRALAAVEQGRLTERATGALSSHRDYALALVYGLRSGLAFLALSAFWLATAWSSASGAMILAAVVCSLFASRENAVQIGFSFIRGIALAIPVAFFVGQLLLPQWSGFPLLCLALGVPLFFGALCMAKPAIGATATSFCLHFIVLVGPQNGMRFDVAFFANEALGMLVGVGCAVLAFRLIGLRNPHWHGRRLLRATLGDLGRLSQRALAGADTWFAGRMADRLLQLARHYPALPEGARSRWDDGLLGLDLGDELLHLRFTLAAAGLLEGEAQRRYFQALERVFQQGPAGARMDALDAPGAALLETLRTVPDNDAGRLAEGAVLQLQHSWRQWCRRREDIDGLA
ncbi:fusaric acid resistance protein [Pseudomonas sp. PIC25]|uniref:FUSC family protein n=1 Tax=Pseudomonas sp. PIC25 TaxID=1958773 RepID=UPI000BABF293|nr:FUSC family protein [Pseudomonas sp. PIC25]PAU54968.1 fusaric acid resistance protein [Pseudomonas sp. PIC25]